MATGGVVLVGFHDFHQLSIVGAQNARQPNERFTELSIVRLQPPDGMLLFNFDMEANGYLYKHGPEIVGLCGSRAGEANGAGSPKWLDAKDRRPARHDSSAARIVFGEVEY